MGIAKGIAGNISSKLQIIGNNLKILALMTPNKFQAMV